METACEDAGEDEDTARTWCGGEAHSSSNEAPSPAVQQQCCMHVVAVTCIRETQTPDHTDPHAASIPFRMFLFLCVGVEARARGQALVVGHRHFAGRWPRFRCRRMRRASAQQKLPNFTFTSIHIVVNHHCLLDAELIQSMGDPRTTQSMNSFAPPLSQATSTTTCRARKHVAVA